MSNCLRTFVAPLLVTIAASSAVAQRQADDTFPGFGRDGSFNPNQMFESMFGGVESEAEAAELAAVEVSTREERRFGQQLLNAMLDQLRRNRVDVERRGPLVEYVGELIEQIQSQMEHADRYDEFDVFIVNTDSVDAMSFPGGSIVITQGMIEFCENEAALVGVLSHELSHIDRQHQLIPLKRGKLVEKSFGGRGFSLERMMRGMSHLSRQWTPQFRKQDETQADEDAARWTFHAGYDPRELAKIFTRIGQHRPDGDGVIPGFLRTHPFDDERTHAILKSYDQLVEEHPDQELKIGREAYLQRLGE